MKVTSNMVFEGGILAVREKGHGDRDGSGYFQLDESDWEPHDDAPGGFVRIEVERSELEWIRDKLNKTLPNIGSTEPRKTGYCPACGGYRAGPCEDCDNGQCTMNCGPAVVDVRGIFEAADAEIAASDTHARTTIDEAAAMRAGVRGLMVRLGLYDLWQHGRESRAVIPTPSAPSAPPPPKPKR